jgi:tetraacyldisaccharide 4'-kinase
MNRAATIALAPLSLLYGAAMKARAMLYKQGLLRVHKARAPVISVGNITTGGTGKTPLVEWIARALARKELHACIITRGYGRDHPQQRVVVSDGEQIISDVREAGDEAMMLARSLLNKAVVLCDSDRVAAANWAIEVLVTDVLILDDGFQHMRLARDLNIVTINATRPFDNGWMLPAGMLREPVSGLARADCVVITRATDGVDPGLRELIRNTTKAVVLDSRMVISRVHLLNSDSPIDIAELRLSSVAAFCGLGNTDAFFRQLRAAEIHLVHTSAFRDHHWYSQSDIDRITKDSVARGAQALVTTAKDEVKLRSLRFSVPCYVVNIELEISDEEQLLQLIDEAVTASPAN